MRGMHRFLAGILLAGAIGGVVVFARHLERVPEPLAVPLSAPPPQHLTAPGAVHAPLRVTAPPSGPFGATLAAVPVRRATTPPLTLTAAKPLKVPHVTTSSPRPSPPAAKTPAATPATPPQQEPVRVLALVPLTPVAPVSTATSTPTAAAGRAGHGKGHAYGHAKHPKAAEAANEPLTPVSQPAPVVVEPTPVDPSSADSGDDAGHDHGNGNGNGRGSDSGNGNGNGRGSGNGNGHGG
jgi:hypothetical protein